MKATLGLEAIGYNTYKMINDFDRFTREAVKQPGNWLYKQIVKGAMRDNDPMPAPCWVAELVLLNDNIYRKYLDSKRDYSRANSKGSRGVYFWYMLESGHVYAVKSPYSWSTTNFYFCIVDDEGEIIKINEDEVEKFLKKESSE